MAEQQQTNSTPDCPTHGDAHLYNVECKMDPEWPNMYIYRQACACGDVQRDWHR